MWIVHGSDKYSSRSSSELVSSIPPGASSRGTDADCEVPFPIEPKSSSLNDFGQEKCHATASSRRSSTTTATTLIARRVNQLGFIAACLVDGSTLDPPLTPQVHRRPRSLVWRLPLRLGWRGHLWR